jgi:hypothetical protein
MVLYSLPCYYDVLLARHALFSMNEEGYDDIAETFDGD